MAEINKIKSIRHYFTIIELMVVITIIVILAAVLLPALNKAKERARGIQCMNNQKQIGNACAMYQGDFNGYMPGANTGNVTFPYLGLTQSMTRFAHGLNLYLNLKITYNDISYYGFKAPNPLQCPSDRRNAISLNQYRSYGTNYYINWTAAAAGDSLAIKMSRPYLIKKPSQFIFTADCANATSPSSSITFAGGTYPFTSTAALEQYVDCRHSNAAGTLWLDLHAEVSPLTKLLGTHNKYCNSEDP